MRRVFATMITMALAAAAVAGLAGCEASPVAACTSDSHCPPGQRCVAGTCRPAAVDAGTLAEQGSPDQQGCEPSARCGGSCCSSGQVCLFATCLEEPPSCSSDKDCQQDGHCVNGQCIPWGVGPDGDRNERLQLPAAARRLLTEKAVRLERPAQRRRPSRPQERARHADGGGLRLRRQSARKRPSVVFVSYDFNDGGTGSSRCDQGYFGVIRVISGNDCAQQFTVDAEKVRAAAPLALADLDGDGRPEIVAARCGGGLVAFRYDPAAKSFVVHWTSSPADLFATANFWDGPSIHDLDDDGKPEILL